MATVNFNFSSVFDKDVIINRNGTTTDPTQDGLSVWNETLVTQTFATFKVGANGNGLPDNGFFAANSYHPAIQLGYSNSSDGNNAKILNTNNTSFTFNVTSGQYSAIHLFATSADGTAGIEVKFNYSDGTNETKTGSLPDWFDTISETSDKYYLIDGMDRSFDVTGSSYDDANTVALYGLKFAPNSSKSLPGIAQFH
ncbi:hypothetical protein ACE1B6_03320 [Aerosakkonemataceae cyanobacterium BLCC-F154]|uniref:Uncharacterized protein n=1 Tax=Floridaenema fluviatile BLCC-F154 TaxID=3153640 RepID=A0ABV4Y661_9CYAN